jgi:hypothetical protein
MNRLLQMLGDEYGHIATASGDGDGREIRLVVSGTDGRAVGLAATAQIQQTCLDHGYLPYAQEASEDGATVTIDCHTGLAVRGIVQRVTLDSDGLLVKLEADDIHCVPLPGTGTTPRRRQLMTKAGDEVTLRLVESGSGELHVGELRNHTLGDA